MEQREWKIPYRKPMIPDEIRSEYGALLSELLYLRDFKTKEDIEAYLSGGEDLLHDPFLLKDMDKAVARILEAIERNERIAVFGDYDVDGITATCIVTEYLKSRGVSCIPYIPVREEEGYGLNKDAIDEFSNQRIRLIITVDCGITAVEEAEYARSKGIDVIITDHHECSGAGIPEAAVAVIDCKRYDDTYPYKGLAGVGVALKLVCACDSDPSAVISRFCDLAAIGTVADVMPLTGENRYIVRYGLDRINHHNTRPGIAAMLESRGREGRIVLNSSNISFSLAPRLNAAGRIGQPLTAVRLLMTDNPSEAVSLVRDLDDLNERRKAIGEEIWDDALNLLGDSQPEHPIVLASDKWHQGVIGIVASRLAELYKLPAILICLDGENGKGSCRSYSDFNLFSALSCCAEHLTGFGGHALAAGLNIKEENIDAFREALKEYYLCNKPSDETLSVCDYAVSDPTLLTENSIRSLDFLEPCGNANPKPVMCLTDAVVLDEKKLGNAKQHLKLTLSFRGAVYNAIFFSYASRCTDSPFIGIGSHVDVAFSPQINRYNGTDSVQLVVSDLKLHSGLELCTEILRRNREALYFCGDYIPSRELHCIPIWKTIRGMDRLPADRDELLALCPSGVDSETFCLCLSIFYDVGLLTGPSDGIMGARIPVAPPKVDLESAETLCFLRRLTLTQSPISKEVNYGK